MTRTVTSVRPRYEVLAKLPPAFGGVQTGGNSSGIVDGARCHAGGVRRICAQARQAAAGQSRRRAPLSVCLRRSWASVRFPRFGRFSKHSGLRLDQIDRFEINEAFAAQTLACERELGLDHAKLNVNGGAIAIGHPLAATGVRLAITLARELKRSGGRYGIASACIGGGQGIALLVENRAAEPITRTDN